MATRKEAARGVDALVKEIRGYCRTHGDPVNATKWQRYFSEGYDAWGLLDKENPLWSTVIDEWRAKYSAFTIDDWIEAGAMLFSSGKYEEGALAIRFLKPHADSLKRKHIAALDAWFDGGIRNWAHTDVLCGEILSPLLASGKMKPAVFDPWRSSLHRFQRRAAAVAVLGLLKIEGGPADALDFAAPMMEDSEKVVQQGLGWLIKEVWKIDAKLAEQFLSEWKDRSPRLIISTACEKMPAGKKAQFKASRRKA